MRATSFTKEELADAVASSRSYAEVLRRLGFKQAGGTQQHVKRLIAQTDLDLSHFKGQRWRNGEPALNRKNIELIFVRLPEGSPRTKVVLLRRALLEVGVPFKCELCPLEGLWNDLPLMLEVDHRDGDRLNNLKENLRFLCPNCHSQQTDTNRPWRHFKKSVTQ